MVDVVNNVSTRFSVVDQASQPLAAMSGAAGRVSSLFNRASSTLGSFGILAGAAAGAFSAVDAVKGTMSFLESVKKVRDFTKMSAVEAGGLVDILDDAGITGQEAVTAMNRLAMAGNKAKTAASGFGGQTKAALHLFKQFGLAGKTPQQQFMQLAKSAQAHKLSIQDLQRLYRLPPESARKLIDVLGEGPEAIQKQIAAFKKLGIATDDNVNRVYNIQKAQRRIASGWDKIKMAFVTALLPHIEHLMKYVEDHIDSWTTAASHYGKVFGEFLTDHLDLVRAIGKAMMYNFLLQKATGTGLGEWASKAGGLGMKGGRGLWGMLSRGGLTGNAATAALGGKTGGALSTIISGEEALPFKSQYGGLLKKSLLSRAATRAGYTGVGGGGAASFFEMIKSKLTGTAVLSGESMPLAKTAPMWSKIVPMLTRSAPTLLKFVMGASKINLVVTAILAVVYMVTKAVSLIRSNYEGLKTHLMLMIDTWKARLAVIGDLLSPVIDTFKSMWDSTSEFFSLFDDFFGEQMMATVMVLADAIDGILHVIQTIVYVITHLSDVVKGGWRHGWGEAFQKGWSETARLTAEKERKIGIRNAEELGRKRKEAAAAATSAKPPENYNDFRGSKFDITQTFAEGFDPDRIAVAFSNDLAALADKKIGQGFNPLFSGT